MHGGRPLLLPLMLAAAFAVLFPHAAAAAQVTEAQSSSQLKRLSIEELAKISVLSVSRHTEPVTEAAAAITVLTGDVLRRAGVRTLPDALRLAVGVAVGRAGHAWSISARGFNSAASNKMVVLLDGRSLYTPLFSGVFWETPDVLLADVDRIEVIRGAGATLWGANAMNGVINIITKLSSDTQGALVQLGVGTEERIAAVRYGGGIGSGTYRAYATFRHLEALPSLTGQDSGEPMGAGQAGMRLDFGPATRTAMTLQGDVYRGSIDLTNAANIDVSGGNLLTRLRHTYASGSQLQVQAYYDNTYRRVPAQYSERRHTADVELQYRFFAGRRHELVSGAGVTVSADRTTPTPTFFFEPADRTITLVNVFAQDEISLLADRLSAIVGAKFEHNSYTGFEVQPTARLRWKPAVRHVIWGGVSRAVRMPTRFDTDLRFTANQPVVVLRGSGDFRSETMVSGEIGYRTFVLPTLALSATAFSNHYDRVRSQEPTPPLGIPIVLANQQRARIDGVEIGVQYEPVPAWHVTGGYAGLRERFEFSPESRDLTGGSLEHNDPARQFWLRSFTDLPGRFAFDATFRWVAALPNPVVPSYSELTLRVARPIAAGLDLELIGDNLLHDRHPEWFNLGPRLAVPRSIFLRLTWQSR